MPKLPDPTLSPSVPSSPAPAPSGSIKDVIPPSDLKKSPFRFVGPLILALILAGSAFVVTRFVIIPRLQPEAVTLTYWGLWEPPEVMKPVIDKYQTDHPGVSINYVMQSKQEYRERLQSALARGEGPDIFRLHSSWMPMFADQIIPADSQQYSTQDFNQTFYPVAGADLIRDGKVVALPLGIDGLGLFVNNDHLASTSSGVPTNWDDLREVAFSLTIRDGKGRITRSGMAMGTTNNVTHWPDILNVLMLQNSVDLAHPDAMIDAQGRNLGADALRYYTIFATQDRIWDENLPPDFVSFASGKVSMMFAPSWQAHQILELNPDLDFTIHPIPQLTSQRRITWASYWVEAVSKHSSYQKESWDFLKFLTSREALQIIYAEASKVRAFGEPYPRRDMAETLKQAKYVGPFVIQAPDAKSWYGNSLTNDNGINDEIIGYYQNAIDSINQKIAAPEEAIATAAKGVQQVLSKYGVK